MRYEKVKEYCFSHFGTLQEIELKYNSFFLFLHLTNVGHGVHVEVKNEHLLLL
jgi:hypothetical protein